MQDGRRVIGLSKENLECVLLYFNLETLKNLNLVRKHFMFFLFFFFLIE